METALIAAVIAAAAAVFAALMAWLAATQARRSNDRSHAWNRIVWTVSGEHAPEHDISEHVLTSMKDLRWAPRDDRALAASLLDRLATDDAETSNQGAHPC
ncbi:hypothetical protein BIU98_01205 [Curtobacterium sp. MMLR14_010]|uniref:hypothetical protein n=1 Tax=Curtobacterium sp. MMLR14_010 TaxID=1898743 RepID=UPI0008DDC5BF|nr:hypothetical protein [Curtobacterium sp. MMLR14_010]OII34633.1 hypothetical protein BIU98_01205 [Curtobacterium sp. MMLR14_010]